MRKNIFFCLFLFFVLSTSYGQNEELYKAYISNKMDTWKENMDSMERKFTAEESKEALLDLTVAQYGYVAYCMSMKQKKKAKSYVLKAEVNAKQMLDYNHKWARAHALLGAIYGFKAGQAPYKAPVLGIRAMKEVNKAFVLDPGDPHIWMEKGNVELYKPAIFGGNKHEAIRHYLKAIDLFEEDPEQLDNSWLYLNTLSGLATAYVRTNQVKKADQTYRKILRIEPAFVWIRDDVYPSFRRKYSEE